MFKSNLVLRIFRLHIIADVKAWAAQKFATKEELDGLVSRGLCRTCGDTWMCFHEEGEKQRKNTKISNKFGGK